MAIVYLIPGLGETALDVTEQPSTEGYPSATTMLLGHVRILTLAPNGIDPGPPHGRAMSVGDVLVHYISTPRTALEVQYAFSGTTIQTFRWDWRKTIYPAGQALAARIRQDVSAANPCTLVGHSAGGLVARAAWTDLGTTGDTTRIRRIVTLGTPHWGSYAAVRFFQGHSSAIDVCKYWNLTVGGTAAGWNPGLTGYVALETMDYQLMALTWPSLYEILPVLGAPSAGDDPLRLLLYDRLNWGITVQPQQVWLDYARNVTGPWLRSAASQPPPDVLTCVAGTGFSSPTQLVSQEGFADGDGLGAFADGDGLVAGIDSIIPGSTAYRYVLLHDNIMVALGQNGELKELIDQDNPVPAPAPRLASTEIPPNYVGPIPSSAIPTLIPNTGTACAGGVCSC